MAHRRRRKRRATQRPAQRGRAVLNPRGEKGEINFPDRGSQPLQYRVEKYQHRPGDGFGSHMNGRHKLG